jgi:hypothetical protein
MTFPLVAGIIYNYTSLFVLLTFHSLVYVGSEHHISNPMASTEMARPNTQSPSSDVKTPETGPVNKENSEAIQYPRGMVLVLIVIALVMSNFLVALDLV